MPFPRRAATSVGKPPVEISSPWCLVKAPDLKAPGNYIFFRKKRKWFEAELSKPSSDLAQRPASRMRSGATSPLLTNGIFQALSVWWKPYGLLLWEDATGMCKKYFNCKLILPWESRAVCTTSQPCSFSRRSLREQLWGPCPGSSPHLPRSAWSTAQPRVSISRSLPQRTPAPEPRPPPPPPARALP